MKFKLHSEYQPAGDQPRAIEALAKGVKAGARHQTLLGVTGSGKTFTVANVIEKIQKPTLVKSGGVKSGGVASRFVKQYDEESYLPEKLKNKGYFEI